MYSKNGSYTYFLDLMGQTQLSKEGRGASVKKKGRTLLELKNKPQLEIKVGSHSGLMDPTHLVEEKKEAQDERGPIPGPIYPLELPR